MFIGKDPKTSWAGYISGLIVGFGTPVVNILSGMPADLKLRDFLVFTSLAVLGRMASDSSKPKE